MSEKWPDITGYDPGDETKRRPRHPYHNTPFKLDTGEICLINSAFDPGIQKDYLFVETRDGYMYTIDETPNGLLQGKRIDTRSKVEAEP